MCLFLQKTHNDGGRDCLILHVSEVSTGTALSLRIKTMVNLS